MSELIFLIILKLCFNLLGLCGSTSALTKIVQIFTSAAVRRPYASNTLNLSTLSDLLMEHNILVPFVTQYMLKWIKL